MRNDFQLLYTDMLQDTARCLGLELSDKEKIEDCFWISSNYWDRLKAIVKDRPFRDDREEIEFFREVKPTFTCHIEYYVLLSSSLSFVPTEPAGAIQFWEDEMGRFRRFCDKNNGFVTYYESGDRYQDSLYFLRSGTDVRKAGISPTIDRGEELITIFDPLVRSYLANKMYHDYCRSQIANLKLEVSK